MRDSRKLTDLNFERVDPCSSSYSSPPSPRSRKPPLLRANDGCGALVCIWSGVSNVRIDPSLSSYARSIGMSESRSGQGGADEAKNSGVSRRILERLPIPGDHRELVVAE